MLHDLRQPIMRFSLSVQLYFIHISTYIYFNSYKELMYIFYLCKIIIYRIASVHARIFLSNINNNEKSIKMVVKCILWTKIGTLNNIIYYYYFWHNVKLLHKWNLQCYWVEYWKHMSMIRSRSCSCDFNFRNETFFYLRQLFCKSGR